MALSKTGKSEIAEAAIDISVIIPVYNAGPLINRCLDSVFKQASDLRIEVILIDDGSEDDSVNLILRRPEQDKIQLLTQSNSGPSAARNRGIRAAKGKYLAFLDADDYWLPGFLAQTKQFLDSHPECVAVSVAQRHITVDGDHESPSNWSSLANQEGEIIEDFFSFWARHNHICTGSILIRTDVAKATGGMREELRSCEDLELWANIASRGKMGYIPQILFVSDGNKVTQAQGWRKYSKRFAETRDFAFWSERLRERLTPEEFQKCTPRFNQIVLGITRSFICAGKYKAALSNLRFYNEQISSHYIIKLAKKGNLTWYSFARFYHFYRYMKITGLHFKSGISH